MSGPKCSKAPRTGQIFQRFNCRGYGSPWMQCREQNVTALRRPDKPVVERKALNLIGVRNTSRSSCKIEESAVTVAVTSRWRTSRNVSALGCRIPLRCEVRLMRECMPHYYKAAAWHGAGGELRLYLRPLPKLADKSALIEYILTAPAAEIFCSGIPHMPFPAAPQRRDERPCAVCGELTREGFLQIRCGVPICADCAEKQSPDR